MDTSKTYYLLKTNHNLQTIVVVNDPYILASLDKSEILKEKDKLEIECLRAHPIDCHFDHHEVDCEEEMIKFDKYLWENYGCSFLEKGFDHSKKEINGQIVYGIYFSDYITDKDLLEIQKKMNRYHFELIEQEPNGKFIIVVNPDCPLGGGEKHELTPFFDSKSEAQNYIDKVIEELFDIDGTSMIIGYTTFDDLTDKTNNILRAQSKIRYKSNSEDYGRKFVAEKKLSEIENGMKILMQLLESVNKTPYQIVELR